MDVHYPSLTTLSTAICQGRIGGDGLAAVDAGFSLPIEEVTARLLDNGL